MSTGAQIPPYPFALQVHGQMITPSCLVWLSPCGTVVTISHLAVSAKACATNYWTQMGHALSQPPLPRPIVTVSNWWSSVRLYSSLSKGLYQFNRHQFSTRVGLVIRQAVLWDI